MALSRRSGFTLIELLVSVALAAMLITAAAHTAGAFAEITTELDEALTDDLAETLSRVSADVRYAWWVDVPSRDRIRVADPTGAVTEYYLYGTTLMVRRPDGSEGVVARGVADAAFDPVTMQRLREGSPAVDTVAVYQQAPPLGTPKPIWIVPGMEVGLGYFVFSRVGPDAVPSVDEQVIRFQPTVLELPVSQAVALPGTLEVQITEASAPGRGERRSSAMISRHQFPVSGLPATKGFYVDEEGEFIEPDDNGPSIMHENLGRLGAYGSTGTIASEVMDILNYLDTTVGREALYAAMAPTAFVRLDLSGISQQLRPGVAYTITVRVYDDKGSVLLPGYSLASADEAVTLGFAGSAGDTASLPYTIPFRLEATRQVTTTVTRDVVGQVRITLTPDEGSPLTSSTAVLSQVLVPDPWAGVVPGEVSGGT